MAMIKRRICRYRRRLALKENKQIMTVVMAMEKVRTRKRGVDHQGVVIRAKIPALRENMEKVAANLAAPLDT